MKRIFGGKDKDGPSREDIEREAAKEMGSWGAPPSGGFPSPPSPPPSRSRFDEAPPPRPRRPLAPREPEYEEEYEEEEYYEEEPPPPRRPPRSSGGGPSWAQPGSGGSMPAGPGFFSEPGGAMGQRYTPREEEESVTELALMDLAKKGGRRAEDIAIRADPSAAEAMRDRALREYMERQERFARQRREQARAEARDRLQGDGAPRGPLGGPRIGPRRPQAEPGGLAGFPKPSGGLQWREPEDAEPLAGLMKMARSHAPESFGPVPRARGKAKPKAAAKAKAKPAAKPAARAKPKAKPAAKPKAKPAAQPKPKAKVSTKPKAKPTAKAKAKATAKPKPSAKPKANAASKPKPKAKPAKKR